MKCPPSVCLDATKVLLLAEIPKPQLTPWKPLRFKDEERAEAEMLFLPEELETGYKLSKEGSLPLIHMEMWLWLLARDFELSLIKRIVLLSPSKMSHICVEMQQPDAAERFVELVGTLGAELKAAKLILLPVWGDDPEHWTFLILKSEEGKWTAQYKDSLSGLHKGCQGNAQRLATLLSCAVSSDVKFPADRCNRKMQPKGSLECGFFVCHWLEQSIREELGEGPFAIGLPKITRVYERLHNCSSSIVRNKGWAALHEQKAAKAQEALEKKKAEKAQRVGRDREQQGVSSRCYERCQDQDIDPLGNLGRLSKVQVER